MLQDIFFVVAFAERSFAWQDLGHTGRENA